MSATDIPEASTDPRSDSHSLERSAKRFGDTFFRGLSTGSGVLILLILSAVAAFLVGLAIPALLADPETFQFSRGQSFWKYVAPYAFGTMWSAILAMIMAVPVAVGIALYLTHYAPKRISSTFGYIIDLLAAVPSVVFGLWGIAVLAPAMRPLFLWLNGHFSWIPLFAGQVSGTGRTIFPASVVLAVMILPIITSMARDIFQQTPKLLEEAALGLGATKWEMIKLAVLPFGKSGIVSASMLGLGRALGETMAVLMILSPGLKYSFKLLQASQNQTIAANIAAQYPEADSIGVSVLIGTGLVLFVLTFLVNLLARRITEKAGK